jgi:hypothetical protein
MADTTRAGICAALGVGVEVRTGLVAKGLHPGRALRTLADESDQPPEQKAAGLNPARGTSSAAREVGAVTRIPLWPRNRRSCPPRAGAR